MTLVLVAHGSRDPRTLPTVHALLDHIRTLRPHLPTHLGHIELNAPLLTDTLASLDTDGAVLVPLLLSRGHHVTHDIPTAARQTRIPTLVAAPSALTPSSSTPCTPASWRPAGRRAGHHPPAPPPHRRRPRRRRLPATRTPPSTPPAPPPSSPTASASPSSPPTPPPPPPPSPPPCAHWPPAPRPGRRRLVLHRTRPLPHGVRRGRPVARRRPLGAHPAMARLVLHRYDEALARAATRTGPRSRFRQPQRVPTNIALVSIGDRS